MSTLLERAAKLEKRYLKLLERQREAEESMRVKHVGQITDLLGSDTEAAEMLKDVRNPQEVV